MRTIVMFLTSMLVASNAPAALIRGPLNDVWREVSASTHINFAFSSFRISDVKDYAPQNQITSKVDSNFGTALGLAVATELPLVTAVAHSNYTYDRTGAASALATASLAFSVVVDSRFGEPDVLGQVPVSVEARWRVSADPHGGSAKVSASFINLPGIRGFEASVLPSLFPDSDAGTLSQSVQMRVGSIVDVTMMAQASCRATYIEGALVNPYTTADGFALLDPVFTFDQARFDAERAAAGLESFKLDDVYQLVFSPGIQNLPSPDLVPLPTSASMLLSGALAMLTGCRRRRRCTV